MEYKKLYIYSINNDYRTSYFKSPPIEFMESLNWLRMDLNTNNILNNYELFTKFY